MDAVTEAGEAWDAWKEGNRHHFEIDYYSDIWRSTFEKELADIFIVISGLAKQFQLDLRIIEKLYDKGNSIGLKYDNVGSSLLDLTVSIGLAKSEIDFAEILCHIMQISKKNNIDLYHHIEEKIKFNEMKL